MSFRSCLTHLRFFYSTVFFVAFAAWPSSAQVTTSPQSAAPQAGVLLAYSGHGGYSQYQTAWIVFSANNARVAVTVPDIIVPRSTGFWRLGSTVACEFSADSQQDASREIIWQSSVEKTPVFNQGPPCKSHKSAIPDQVEEEENSAPADSSGAQVPLCPVETASILFVSPTHLAERFNDYDRCDPRGGRDTTRDDVRALDDPAPISLTDLFGAAAANSYRSAEQKGFAENSKDYNCPEPDDERFDLKSWSVSHRRGAWAPLASLNQWMGECVYSYQMNLTLPKAITAEVSKAEHWKSFAAAVPHLEDFFLSPLGDYALILVSPKNADYHLYAYSVQNGALAKRLAELPWDNYNSYPVVMAQWSSAKYVPQWTAAIQKIQSQPLPAAVPQYPLASSAPK